MWVWLQLIRWKNLVLIALSQILIVYFLYPNFSIQALFFMINTLFITAAGNVINDCLDIETDLINKPDKVIISKKVSLKFAYLVYFLLNALAFALNGIGFYLCHNTLLFISINAIMILLYLYSKYLKGVLLLGNITVATLSALSVLLFLLVYETNSESSLVLFILSAFAFSLNLIREMVKDVEDIKGDRNSGLKTLPIVVGKKRATAIFSGLMLLVTLSLSLLCFWMHLYLRLYTCLLLILPMVYLYKLSNQSKSKADYSKLSNLLKWVIGFGILSIIII